MKGEEIEKLRHKLSKVFVPGEAIDKYELFSGRREQVVEVTNAIMQPGRHVVLFGDRGVGKTSLAKVLHEVLTSKGIHALASKTINCDWSDNFSTLWHKTLCEIPVVATNPSPDDAVESLADLLPENVTPNDVRRALTALVEPSIIVIDEINRLQDQSTKILLADTIKTLSDHSVDTTLILIGVADAVDELVAEHRSIERSLVQVRMPRMKKKELKEIIDIGLDKVSMGIEPSSKDMIARLSQGLPYYTHYLGLYAGYNTLDEERTLIKMVDVMGATARVVQNDYTVMSDFYKATRSSQKNFYEEVLIACAVTEPDDMGFFAPADISFALSTIMGKPYYVNSYQRHLNEFSDSEQRGRVLHKIGVERNFRYRFADPLMQPFAILYGIAKGKIGANLLLETQRRSPMEFEVINGAYGDNAQEELPF